jgi:hypothetical protein
MKKAGKVAADEFILKVIEGHGLRPTDPALYCRNRMLQLLRRTMANARIDLLFKCWNAWRRHQRIERCHLSETSLPKVEG